MGGFPRLGQRAATLLRALLEGLLYAGVVRAGLSREPGPRRRSRARLPRAHAAGGGPGRSGEGTTQSKHLGKVGRDTALEGGGPREHGRTAGGPSDITGEHCFSLVWNCFLWLRCPEGQGWAKGSILFSGSPCGSRLFPGGPCQVVPPAAAGNVPSAPRPGQLGLAHLGVK